LVQVLVIEIIYLVPVYLGLRSLPVQISEFWSLIILIWVALCVAIEDIWREYWERQAINTTVNEKAKEKIRELSAALVEALLGVIVQERLRVPGRARSFIYVMNPESGKLKIAHSHNMQGAPDYRFEYEPVRGWAGHVWVTRKEIVSELSGLNAEQVMDKWGFNMAEYQAIRRSAGIESFIYEPIYDPTNPDRLIAVLGIDSNRRLHETKFHTTEIQHKTVQSAIMLAALLIDGDLV